MFAVVLVVSVVFIVFFVPETSGKSLEDIERLYANTADIVCMENVNANPAVCKASSYHRVSSLANLKATPSFIQ